ncbi:hypothetical protein [Paracoccus sphaerophysae]|nr:hypothetical protein [Paracoccus sphaerophysae]
MALRHGGQLVAVLSRKDDGTVDALNGPENDPVAQMRRPREDALAA